MIAIAEAGRTFVHLTSAFLTANPDPIIIAADPWLRSASVLQQRVSQQHTQTQLTLGIRLPADKHHCVCGTTTLFAAAAKVALPSDLAFVLVLHVRQTHM